ncbi:MAG TPA: PAS domain S-box protein [Candidatus Thiothrix moscowensis]|uniref:PAS domain S-box protein n=1 Tax=unclassified Thiothrix TaxID=2636184 RepID=UPI0025F081E7|nr:MULTISPECIES: PAS domain S-box protein [unclassified Thiothrix]HRJ54404.1 PAS domain S-box protein [Candidatus Thiothrix moscowensis]HRJ94732.1 PAS domain S-box protein [Candidatus Thiothrix moscowensis]
MRDIPTEPVIRPDLLQALLDRAEHGITIAEREGSDTILLYVNHAFEKMTGYSAEECLYKDCRFLQGNDTEQAAITLVRNAIEAEQPVRAVLRNYRKDGSLFWNDLSISPYFDEEDGIMYYIGVQKDVSELVTLQEEITTLRNQLASYENP